MISNKMRSDKQWYLINTITHWKHRNRIHKFLGRLADFAWRVKPSLVCLIVLPWYWVIAPWWLISNSLTAEACSDGSLKSYMQNDNLLIEYFGVLCNRLHALLNPFIVSLRTMIRSEHHFHKEYWNNRHRSKKISPHQWSIWLQKYEKVYLFILF